MNYHNYLECSNRNIQRIELLEPLEEGRADLDREEGDQGAREGEAQHRGTQHEGCEEDHDGGLTTEGQGRGKC